MNGSTLDSLGKMLLMAHGAAFVLLAAGWLSTILIRSLSRRHRACDVTLILGLIGFCLVISPHPTLTMQAQWQSTLANRFKLHESLAPLKSNLDQPNDITSQASSSEAIQAGLKATAPTGPNAIVVPHARIASVEIVIVHWKLIVALTYCMMGAILALWLMLGGLHLHGIRRRSVLRGTDEAGYPILESPDISQPCCFGLLYPVICLPHAQDTSMDWTHVIRHESAHLQRRDPWSRTFANVMLPLFYIQPFYWLVRRQAIVSSEYLADELAASRSDRVSYAAGLVDCLRKISSESIGHTWPAMFLSVSARTLLLSRVQMLHEQVRPTGKSATWKWLAWYLLPMVALLLGVVAMTGASRANSDGDAEGILGRWIDRDDYSSAFASTDPSIPGAAFQLIGVSTKGVSGVVTDAEKKPVAAAEIWFSGYNGRIPLRERTMTNEEGGFSVQLPMGQAFGTVTWSSIAVHKNMYRKLLQIGNADNLDWQLSPGRTIAIRAVEEFGGKAIRDFLVHTSDGRIISSNASGECMVEGLEPSIQYLCATGPNRASQTWMMDLSADRTVDYEVEMPPGRTVEGTVHDEQGNPVAWNIVRSFQEQSVLTVGTSFSDEGGRYRLSGLRLDRPISIAAFSHESGESTQVFEDALIRLGESKKSVQDFTVTPNRHDPPGDTIASLSRGHSPAQGYFRGKVIYPDGSACKRFQLRIMRSRVEVDPSKAGSYAASYSSHGIVYSSADGSFQFSGLEVGRCVAISISTAGYRDQVVDPATAVSKDNLASSPVHEVTLRPLVSVQLKVRGRDGNPVRGAVVRLFRKAPESRLHDYEKDRFLFESSADSSGMVVFHDVSLAVGRWIVEASGFAEQQFPWIGSSEVELVLKKSKTLRLRFQFEDDLKRNLSVSLRRSDGSFVAELDGLSPESPVWSIPELLPDVYYLSPTSTRDSKYRFQFAGEDRAPFRWFIDLTKDESPTQEFSISVKPYEPDVTKE